MTLSKETCEPCHSGETPLPADDAKELAQSVPKWTLSEKQIDRKFEFQDFKQAMAFVNDVAQAAEAQGHHPDIFISYKMVELTLITKKIDGLSRNDFILAARIDELADNYTRG